MKRGKLVSVSMAGPTRVYGQVWTSSASAVREAMHEALDVWIDERFGPTAPESGPGTIEREVYIEVSE